MSEVLLAVDTCGPRPRVGLRVDARVTTAEPAEGLVRADDAASLADGLFRAAGVAAADLTGIGVTIGPGSYTGVRIGLALVRGLSLVDRVPVVGMGTLELLAAAAPGSEGRICAFLDAGAGKVYAAVFARMPESLGEVVAARVLDRSQVAAFVDSEAAGASLVRCADEPEVHCGCPVTPVAGSRVAALARIASQRLQRGQGSSAELVLPLYVGATGARPNRNKVVATSLRDE